MAGDWLKAAIPWIAAQFAADAPRQFLWAPVFLGAGIGVYFAAPVEPPMWAAFLTIPALAIWLWTLRQDGLGTAFAAAAVFWAVTGFAAATLRTATLATPVLAADTKRVRVEGRVEQIMPLDNGAKRIVLAIERFNRAPSQLRARITLRAPGAVAPGRWIALTADLRSPPPPVAPGSFDFGRFLWFQGIGATGFAIAAPSPIEPLRPRQWREAGADTLSQLRQDMSDRIRAAMSPEMGPIATAFLTGERSAIDEELMVAFRDSSLAHLLSISGLHMVMAGFGFFNALRLILVLIPGLALRWPVKKVAAAGALIASCGYLLISGAATPTVRSFLMIALVFIAMMADRPGITMRQVALAALAILLVAPESLLDVSFQMSFGAVVALVAAYEWAQSRPQNPNPGGWLDTAWAWFSGAAATSFVAGLATTPFAIFHFHRVADYGVIANLLALPAVGLIVMPAGVLALVAMPFGLEAWPLMVMEWGLLWVTATAVEVASWPGAAFSLAAMPPVSLLLIILGALWLCLWRERWRLFGGAVIALGVAVSPFSNPPDILIAAGGKTFAVRQADGTLAVPRIARGRFEAETWLRSSGDNRTLPAAKEGSEDAIRCTKDRCSAAMADMEITFLRAGSADSAECIPGDLVIGAPDVATACEPTARVITQRALISGGAAAIWRVSDAWRIQTAVAVQGQRPWVPLNSAGSGQSASPEP